MKPIPQVLYPCAIEGCAEESSHPPERLYWFDGNAEFPEGWYCPECFQFQLTEVISNTNLRDILESQRIVDAVFEDVRKELRRAINKFPKWTRDPVHAAGVVNEESGELTKAVLQAVYENGRRENVREEAVQTAAMAVRFIMGVGLYEFDESHQYTQEIV